MSTSKRGFARMSEEERQRLAYRAGVEAHRSGNAHEFNGSAKDIEAAKKGGLARSADRKEMADIGRKGGLASAAKRAQRRKEIGDTP